MKKNIITILFAAGFILSLGSCSDYLDMDHLFKDRTNIDTVFARKHLTDRWLSGVYNRLTGHNADVSSKGHTPFNYISDDMYFGDRDNAYKMYKNGEYNEGTQQETWGQCYGGIRDASIFIDNIDRNRELNAEEKLDYKGQARFLRAYYYWLLIRKYGPVPLVPIHGFDYTLSYDELAIPRNSYDECVDFITSELALAAQELPLQKRTNRELARPVRASALAARAKVFLFAASPLYNGNTAMAGLVDDKGRKLISQEYSEIKWARAAAAAKELIQLSEENNNMYHLFTAPYKETAQGPSQPPTIKPPVKAPFSDLNFPEGWADIDPFESYRQLFNGALSAEANPELLFSRVTEQSTEGIETMVLHQVPSSLKGWNTHGMTLKQCDAYYMNNGDNYDETVTPRGEKFTNDDVNSPEYFRKYLPLPKDVSLQYANREPRFYASVAYNGSIWENRSAIKENERNQQIFYYRGTPNGKRSSAPMFWLRTGIGIKKYYNPIDSWLEGGFRVNKPEPAIRYTEILLIYAEAMNELKGPHSIARYDGKGTIDVNRDKPQMSKYMTMIRVRAGLPDFESVVYNDRNAFLKALKRERQIELFAEGHRYYDLRRWKDAEKEEGLAVTGCNMDMSGSNEQKGLYYDVTKIPSMPTIFTDKMYLWPISHNELRRNKRLTQNPGWTYYY